MYCKIGALLDAGAKHGLHMSVNCEQSSLKVSEPACRLRPQWHTASGFRRICFWIQWSCEVCLPVRKGVAVGEKEGNFD